MNPLRVFIVDDNIDLALSLADILRDENYYVECAHTGEEAMTRLHDQDFDILLLDAKLPDMNGFEVIFEVRKIRPGLKVIMMTGNSVADLMAHAVDGGVHGIFYKPIDLNNLLDKLVAASANGLVLAVDEDPNFAGSLWEILTDNGYSVLVADTGTGAVAQVMANKVDFLVLDLRLPIMSGLEVYWELRNRGHAVPTVIVTACPEEETVTIKTLHQHSVCGYFIKPLDPQVLLPVLNAIAV